MAYLDTDLPLTSGGNNGNGFGSGDGFWAIVLLALLFGNNRGGYGFGGGSGSELAGYEIGKLATTNDVANGFAQNTLQRGIDDILLGQQSQLNFMNQGFAGLNTVIQGGFAGVDKSICNLGYNIATGFNGVNQSIANCCCDIKGILLENRYLNERQTCDLITNQNANTQRIIDLYTSDKINALTAENVALKGRISNDAQTAQIVGALAPKAPVPAYPVFPATSFAHPTGVSFGCGCPQPNCTTIQ